MIAHPFHKTILVLFAFFASVGVGARPAHAQEEAAEKPGRVEITDAARRHFRAGVAFVEDPDGARYADAYREFKLAYAESPSWKILGNLGLAAMKLERDGEAIQALQRYLEQGGDEVEEAERKQFQRDIDMLQASITWVDLTVNVPGAILEDQRTPLSGAAVVNLYELEEGSNRVGIHAGRHRMTVELDGYEPASWTFNAQGGELSHQFDLVPVQQETEPAESGVTSPADPVEADSVKRPVPTAVWVGAGITGALAIGGTVTGILATGKRSDFDSENDGTDPEGAQKLKDSGETLNLVTDIMLGGAVAGAVVTTVLYFTRPKVKTTEAKVNFSPAVLAGGGGAFLYGKF